jgi:hypothetical protein
LATKKRSKSGDFSLEVEYKKRRVNYHSPSVFEGQNFDDLFVSAKPSPIQIGAGSFFFIAYSCRIS